MSEQDGFQVIGRSSGYEIIEESIRQQPGNQVPQLIYEVTIVPGKSDIDLNLVENQFYQMKVYKYMQQIVAVQRRYSDFALIYEILNKKEPGYIFPAFPENGIFAFVYSKLTIAKDQMFIKRRVQVIERFFNSIFNNPQFSPQICKEVKEFLSEGKEFQVRKQLEKKQNGVFGFSWGKIKNLFVANEGGKYQNNQQKINGLKTGFQQLYHNCHQMIQYLHEQRSQNNKIQQTLDNSNYLKHYKKLLISHDNDQKLNLERIQKLQFELFCENEDLLMAKKVIDRMNQLKNDEDNYQQLKHIQQKFNKKIQNFLTQKGKAQLQNDERLKEIINDIKKISRFGNE